MSKPVLTCWGGVGAVTGANFLLEVEDKKYLIDCGLLQGLPGADAENAARFPYDVREVAALFVTHAHADHIGKIPKLVHDGFQGAIYSTRETKEIATLMLADTARITEEDARAAGAEPLFTMADAERAL
jgi:metallo-beta-lactamase family protein